MTGECFLGKKTGHKWIQELAFPWAEEAGQTTRSRMSSSGHRLLAYEHSALWLILCGSQPDAHTMHHVPGVERPWVSHPTGPALWRTVASSLTLGITEEVKLVAYCFKTLNSKLKKN